MQSIHSKKAQEGMVPIYHPIENSLQHNVEQVDVVHFDIENAEKPVQELAGRSS